MQPDTAMGLSVTHGQRLIHCALCLLSADRQPTPTVTASQACSCKTKDLPVGRLGKHGTVGWQ